MGTVGAITAVAATTTVGIAATTMAGGIITTGGEFCLEALHSISVAARGCDRTD